MGSLVPLVKDLGTGTAQTVKGFKDLLDVLSIITEWKNKLLGTDKPEEQNIFQQGATFVGGITVATECFRYGKSD